MSVDSLKKGRRSYAIILAITIASVCTQNPVGMTAGLVVNAVIWWLVVWEVQRDISRRQDEEQGKK